MKGGGEGGRDSKMRVLAQTTTFTTFMVRQHSRRKLVFSLFTVTNDLLHPVCEIWPL